MPTKTRRAKRAVNTPYKHLLPPLSREEFEALRASIQANGVLQPVILDEQQNVLDGHNRLEIDPNAPRRVVRGLSEAEKRAFVFASNMARRNLSPAQKKVALAAMKVVARALREEDPKRNTQKRIAELLGVSRQCVTKWFRPRRRTMHNATRSITHNESAFLADARFTIPQKIRPAIIRRCRSGESQTTIAADFKVAQSTISRIYRRHQADQRAAAQAKRDAARAAPLGDQNIIVGDYRRAGRVLVDGSVDLIFTDPPFDRRHLPQYADLGRFAARVLKPGGSLITYLGDYALPQVLSLVLRSPELCFWWPLAVLHSGRTRILDKFGVVVRHKNATLVRQRRPACPQTPGRHAGAVRSRQGLSSVAAGPDRGGLLHCQADPARRPGGRSVRRQRHHLPRRAANRPALSGLRAQSRYRPPRPRPCGGSIDGRF